MSYTNNFINITKEYKNNFNKNFENNNYIIIETFIFLDFLINNLIILINIINK